MNTTTAYKRIKSGRGFYYVDSGNKRISDQELIDYFQSLVIPPAWKDVYIARSKSAKVLATGCDQAGRQQSIYHPNFRRRQEKLKYDKIMRFGLALPRLRKQLDKDINRRRFNQAKVVATVVKLIDETLLRVGNDRYARANKSYGATTLRSKHTDIKQAEVTFEFIGKSSKPQFKRVTDSRMVRVIKQLDEMPGYNLFRYEDEKGKLHDVKPEDVNRYIKQYMGEDFTAKDFRTWGGTVLACAGLAAAKLAETEKERSKIITATVKKVASKLGNTPAVARASYIDPRIISGYQTGKTDLQKIKQTVDKMRPKKYLSNDERYLLEVLTEVDNSRQDSA